MSEKVVIPRLAAKDLVTRPKPKGPPQDYIPYKTDGNLVPPMAIAGDGYHFHITGLTHDERGYPTMTADAQERLIQRLVDKIRLNKKDIIKYKELFIDDAEIIVCAYGITARIAQMAVKMARDEGLRAGLMQMVTVWPFADDHIKELSSQSKAFIVPEINAGQMVLEVERCVCGKADVISLPLMGGRVHSPQIILEAIRKAVQ